MLWLSNQFQPLFSECGSFGGEAAGLLSPVSRNIVAEQALSAPFCEMLWLLREGCGLHPSPRAGHFVRYNSVSTQATLQGVTIFQI